MRNSYRKNTVATVGSRASAEIRAVLELQDPPMGNKAAADLIGVNYETMRAATGDLRIPSVGIVYGLARVLHLDENWVNKVLALREKDRAQMKINKAIASGPGTSDIENFVTILGALKKSQIEELKKKALSLATANRGSK